MDLAWAEQWGKGFSGLEYEKHIASHYTDDVAFEDRTLAKTAAGLNELRAFFSTLFGPGAGEHRFVVSAYRGDATGGAIEWTWQATHERDLFGIAAKGKTTSVHGVSVVSLREGKIAIQHDYWDAMALVKQLKRASTAPSAP